MRIVQQIRHSPRRLSLVSTNRISDLLCSACEGGSNYWADGAPSRRPSSWPNTDPKDRVYAFNWALNPGGWLGILDKETGKKYRLTLPKIKKGLQLLATERPDVFAQIVQETDDANDADTFLQFCILGKVVYG